MSSVKYASVKVYFIANALDAVLTVIGYGAGLREANPVMAGLLGYPAAFIAVKLAGGIAAAAILTLCPRRLQRAAAAFMGAVAVWNAILIFLFCEGMIKMETRLDEIKLTLTAFFAAVGGFLGWKGLMILALGVFMAGDYISGTLAAKKSGEWSSKVAREGLFHKGGIVIVVAGSLIADLLIMFVIPSIPFFGGALPNPGIFLPLVLAWYIVTEFGSILENAMKMGANVPYWFRKAVENTGKIIEEAGEKAAPEANDDDGT